MVERVFVVYLCEIEVLSGGAPREMRGVVLVTRWSGSV